MSPDGQYPSVLSYDEPSSSLLEEEASFDLEQAKMSTPVQRNSIRADQPLDAIVELNYEASSDEEEIIKGQEV